MHVSGDAPPLGLEPRTRIASLVSFDAEAITAGAAASEITTPPSWRTEGFKLEERSQALSPCGRRLDKKISKAISV